MGLIKEQTTLVLIIDICTAKQYNHSMKQEQNNTKSRIPAFASREEEAAFWDIHDITRYLDELKPVAMLAEHPIQVSHPKRGNTHA